MTGATTSLAEIRSAELAAARAVSEATEAANEQIVAARSSALDVVERARADGRAAADRRVEAAIEQARAEAARIGAEVDDRLEALRGRIEPRIEELAAAMLDELLPKRSD